MKTELRYPTAARRAARLMPDALGVGVRCPPIEEMVLMDAAAEIIARETHLAETIALLRDCMAAILWASAHCDGNAVQFRRCVESCRNLLAKLEGPSDEPRQPV